MCPVIKAVVCGSLHLDVSGMERCIRELQSHGCQVLSPRSLNISQSGSFVRFESEDRFSITEIENWHLQAINLADFVWIHNPGGYCGVSTSLELGYALNRGKKIFSTQLFTDEILNSYVAQVDSVFSAIEIVHKQNH